MSAGEVLDEGWYCTDCGYFEQLDEAGGRCMACGCSIDAHAEVQVVEK